MVSSGIVCLHVSPMSHVCYLHKQSLLRKPVVLFNVIPGTLLIKSMQTHFVTPRHGFRFVVKLVNVGSISDGYYRIHWTLTLCDASRLPFPHTHAPVWYTSHNTSL